LIQSQGILNIVIFEVQGKVSCANSQNFLKSFYWIASGGIAVVILIFGFSVHFTFRPKQNDLKFAFSFENPALVKEVPPEVRAGLLAELNKLGYEYFWSVKGIKEMPEGVDMIIMHKYLTDTWDTIKLKPNGLDSFELILEQRETP